MNSIIISITAIVTKSKISKKRIITSSICGAIYVILKIIVITKLKIKTSTIVEIFEQIICSQVIILIAFYPQNVKQMLKKTIIFFISTFIMGGINLALINIIGKNKLYITIISGIIGANLINYAYKNNKEKLKYKDFIVKIELKINGKIIKLNAFVDSGNHLRDPITNKSVVIIQNEKINIENILKNGLEKNIRIIPYKTIENKNGILFGFKPEYLKVKTENEEKTKDAIIAVSNSQISKKYDAIISYDLIK